MSSGDVFNWSRRALLSAGGAMIAGRALALALVPTPRQTEGPFYPDPRLIRAADADLTRLPGGIQALGEVIDLSGRVIAADGSSAAGVAVEIGVVKLVYLKQALARHLQFAAEQGRSPSRDDLARAVVDGALLRVRPITMTIAALIAGLLPIMLGSGTGAEVMRRIAAPMVGGMVSVMLLTLVVIPATWLLWQRARLGRFEGGA